MPEMQMMKDGMIVERPSPWRWYPLGIAAAMLVVIIVNAGMIWAAVRTFPGAAGEDGFDLSNSYDKVLAESARQAALGWRVKVASDGQGHPVFRAVDRQGNGLAGLTLTARAVRPVGPELATALTFDTAADGTLVAHEVLARGQWAVTIEAKRDGQDLAATERLVIP